ncbi:hypothetical protein GJS41_09670 [Kangiella sp. HZ709]|nr:hypothetical protein [Kangiella sp. HZ709]
MKAVNNILCTLFLGIFSVSILAKESSSETYMPSKTDSAKAMELFQTQEFDKSLDLYQKLAKTGDKHAQYMLSVMYAHGYGTEKNAVESYAWSKLSKETNITSFVEHHKNLSAAYTPALAETSELRYKDLYKQYSDLAVARKYRSLFKKEMPTCTGSRIKGNCGNVTASCNGFGGIPLNPAQEKRCREYAKKLDPLYIARIKNNTAKIEKHILSNTNTSVTVEEVIKEDN